eukprot:403363384
MVSIDQDIVYPEKFNQYEKVEELGAGTYGKVFLYKKKDKKSVFMYKFSSDKAEVKLDVIPRYIYHSTIQDQRLNYLIMERLHLDLNAYYQDKIQNQPKGIIVQQLLLKCIDALRKFHEIGYVHRDIKPGNIMMREDQPILIDFGISQEYNKDLQQKAQNSQNFYSQSLIPGTKGYVSLKMHEKYQIYGPLDDLESLIYSFFFIVNNQSLPWLNSSLNSHENNVDITIEQVKHLKELFLNFNTSQSRLQQQSKEIQFQLIQDYFERNPVINKVLQKALLMLKTEISTNIIIDQQSVEDSNQGSIIDQQNQNKKSTLQIYDQLKQLITDFDFNMEDNMNNIDSMGVQQTREEQLMVNNMSIHSSQDQINMLGQSTISVPIISSSVNTDNCQSAVLQSIQLSENSMHFQDYSDQDSINIDGLQEQQRKDSQVINNQDESEQVTVTVINSKIYDQANQQFKKEIQIEEIKKSKQQSPSTKANKNIEDSSAKNQTKNNIGKGKPFKDLIGDALKSGVSKLFNNEKPKHQYQVKNQNQMTLRDKVINTKNNNQHNLRIDFFEAKHGLEITASIKYQQNKLILKFTGQNEQLPGYTVEDIEAKFEEIKRVLTDQEYETMIQKLRGNIQILRSYDYTVINKEALAFESFIETIQGYYNLHVEYLAKYEKLSQSSTSLMTVCVNLKNLSNQIKSQNPDKLYLTGDFCAWKLQRSIEMKRIGNDFFVDFNIGKLKMCNNQYFYYKFVAQNNWGNLWSNDSSKQIDQSKYQIQVNKIILEQDGNNYIEIKNIF